MNVPRESQLEELRHFLRPCPHWENWLEKSGESAPEWNKLPSQADLPDPLNFQGCRVRKSSDWNAQRRRILQVFRRFIFGSCPETPRNIRARVLGQRREPSGVQVKKMELSFGPGRRARIRFELAIPAGRGRFPVFMTQTCHEGWARIALQRGYATVVYHGGDGHDDTQHFKTVWPEYDWSMLSRRAWGASRILDWLLKQSFVERHKVCLAGHSRNGKQTLMAGAMDSRFSVLIPSSSGVGGVGAYRLANEANFGEGIEIITRAFPEWFHPRLRFFAGREHKLPVDANLLLALCAPRPVLIPTALNDSCENAKASELTVESARRVWNLWGKDAGSRLQVHWRDGEHGTCTETIERYLDWCDLHLGRKSDPGLKATFKARRLFPYSFGTWEKNNGRLSPIRGPESFPTSLRDWKRGAADRVRRLQWLLGEEPAHATRPSHHYGLEPDYVSQLLSRPATGAGTGLSLMRINMGEYVSATIYLPAWMPYRVKTEGIQFPGVIWLHPESIPSGFSGAYVHGEHYPAFLARAGFAVMAFDQIGNGSRLEEGTRFYSRHPRWSLLGKMVQDTRAALAAMQELPFVNSKKIFIAGFGEGATVGLVTAALEPGVMGTVAACGVVPLRKDDDQKTGALGRMALWDGGGLIPRLGLYANHPGRIPMDFDEISGMIAPRPLYCAAAEWDRYVSHAEVLRLMGRVQRVYQGMGAGGNFEFHARRDHRRLGGELQSWMVHRLLRLAGM